MSRHSLPLESDLVPYRAGFPPGERWLFLAPHPDDEVMGAGATIVEARRRNVEVSLVVVTDGGAQGDVPTRKAEAMLVANRLGLNPPEHWGFADRSLVPGDVRLRRRLLGALADHLPDAVFVPSPVELHPDHRALALALQRLLRRRLLAGFRDRPPAWVVAYEVGGPLLPNLLVDVSTSWPAKRELARAYASQLALHPYDEVMEALGTYRCLTLQGCSRAEAFFVMPARDVARRSARSWASLMGSPRGVERQGRRLDTGG